MVIRLLVALLLVTGVARAETLSVVLPEAPQPVVGEMILVTLRGEYTRFITLESLTFPQSADYDWVQLGRDRWRDERVRGRAVKVFERRIALFPRSAGPLTIGPITHQLTVVEGAGRADLPVEAEAVTIAVAPHPGEGVPLAASDLSIEETLSTDPGALRDGETLVRRVTVRANGTVPHLLPLRPAMRQPWLITFTAPEERRMRPTPDGPVTTVTWEWHLRPRTGEPGVIPPVEIPWFDTIERRLRIAEIPPIPLGYRSFEDNRRGADRLPAAAASLALGTVGLGFGVGLVAAVAGFGGRSRSDLRRSLARLSPVDPTRRALRRAARDGDLLALRAAAEPYLRRRHALGLPVTGRETLDLDRAIYGRDPSSTTDAAAFLRSILRHR